MGNTILSMAHDSENRKVEDPGGSHGYHGLVCIVPAHLFLSWDLGLSDVQTSYLSWRWKVNILHITSRYKKVSNDSEFEKKQFWIDHLAGKTQSGVSFHIKIFLVYTLYFH